MKIAIAAAGGQVGSTIVSHLRQLEGVELILLGHQVSSLNKIECKDARRLVVDISHVEEVVQATVGVDALFWMVPPVFGVPSLKEWYRRVTVAGVEAVKRNNIAKVVLLSSLGAGERENLGTVTYAGEMEASFDELDADVLSLRPGYFMENLLMQKSSLSEKNELSFPYAPGHDIPWISADDIGAVAARFLVDEKWSGHWKQNLMGPENITLSALATRMGDLLGREVKYRQSSMEEMRIQIGNWGVSPEVGKEMMDLFGALGDPDGAYATPRTFEAFTPTTLEEFYRKKMLV